MTKGYVVLVLCVLAAAGTAHAVRGRPKVIGNRLVTDRCTPIRGVVWDISDPSESNLSYSMLQSMRNDYGFNATHVYSQRYNDRVNTLIQWSRDLDMYVVISGGCAHCKEGSAYCYDAAISGWSDLASRYANEPHVMFEIINEPFCLGRWASTEDLRLQMDAYNVIHERAPDTHISLWCFSSIGQGEGWFGGLNHEEDFENGVRVVKESARRGIDYSNASVGIHCGNWDTDRNDWKLARTIMELGIPVFMTESHVCADNGCWCCPDTAIQIFKNADEMHIGWLNFYMNHHASGFKSAANTYGFRYNPDFGNWPSSPAGNCGNIVVPGLDADVNWGDIPLTVSFDASSSNGNNLSYEWDLGNGETSTEESPTVTYTEEDTFFVTLTVRDGSGNTASCTQRIETFVNTPFTIDATDFDEATEGITKEMGGLCLGHCDEGYWVRYDDVDFGAGYAEVKTYISLPPDVEGQNIEFRLDAVDGPVVATLTTESTGDWSTFRNELAPLSEEAKGVHDLYVYFTGDAMGSVARFTFQGAPENVSVSHSRVKLSLESIRVHSAGGVLIAENFGRVNPQRISLVDLRGNVLYAGDCRGARSVAVPAARFGPGTFVLRIDAGGHRVNRKIIMP